MRLFGKEHDDEQARKAMKALDEVVNPLDAGTVQKTLQHRLLCGGNPNPGGKAHAFQKFVQDPQNDHRFICAVCDAVMTITIERWPDVEAGHHY